MYCSYLTIHFFYVLIYISLIIYVTHWNRMILEFLKSFWQLIIENPFQQISGFLAMIIVLIAYFQKDDKSVKKLMLLSSLFWGTHFYLLGVYSGLAATIIWIVRLLLSMKYARSFRAFLSIVIITLITGYFTFDGLLSLLPIMTSLTGAYSYFFLEKVKLRLAMMFNSSSWLVYHVYIGSLSGVVNEIFTQIILLATVYRMMHPDGGTKYYAAKIRNILSKTSKPDYDRFIFVHDKVMQYKNTFGAYFNTVIHYDLRKIFRKKVQ